MYHISSGRFDLENIDSQHAKVVQGEPPSLPVNFTTPELQDDTLFRLQIETPSGIYSLGCLGSWTVSHLKANLIQVSSWPCLTELALVSEDHH